MYREHQSHLQRAPSLWDAELPSDKHGAGDGGAPKNRRRGQRASPEESYEEGGSKSSSAIPSPVRMRGQQSKRSNTVALRSSSRGGRGRGGGGAGGAGGAELAFGFLSQAVLDDIDNGDDDWQARAAGLESLKVGGSPVLSS